MYRRDILRLSLAVAIAFLPVAAIAQPKSIKEQLIGAWTLVAVDGVKADGTHTPIFGPNPNGSLIFTTNGRFSAQLMRSNRTPFASKNRDTGTAEENKTMAQGTLSEFGTYGVNEADKSFSMHIEGDSFPNREGIQVMWEVTSITDDTMTINTPTSSNPAAAYATILNVWKKVK
jgi:Lipocalin-like domain